MRSAARQFENLMIGGVKTLAKVTALLFISGAKFSRATVLCSSNKPWSIKDVNTHRFPIRRIAENFDARNGHMPGSPLQRSDRGKAWVKTKSLDSHYESRDALVGVRFFPLR